VVRGAALLALVGAAGLTGCGLFEDEPDPAPDLITPLIAGALELAARYDAAVAIAPELAERLRPIAEAHRAHAAELARVTRTALPTLTAVTPAATAAVSPGSASAQRRAAVLHGLREAEQAGRDAARTACAEAPAEQAALLGSIAAARATHLEILR